MFVAGPKRLVPAFGLTNFGVWRGCAQTANWITSSGTGAAWRRLASMLLLG